MFDLQTSDKRNRIFRHPTIKAIDVPHDNIYTFLHVTSNNSNRSLKAVQSTMAILNLTMVSEDIYRLERERERERLRWL